MQRLFQLALVSRLWPIWARYAVTTILILAAFWLRGTLLADVAGYPFLLFYPAIILAAVFFDRGNGIFATLLAATLSAFFLMEPARRLQVDDPGELLALGIFTGTGILSAALIEALHVALVHLAEANEKLDAAARQRQVLLHELSHRVRNDLMALISLLQVQARASGEDGRAAILAAADRLQVMGRVHQRLTLLDEQVVVDSREFITELCDDLKTALVGLRPISVNVAAEGHTIALERAVPLGLIINELLTNALKYAFPEDRAGKVDVRFKRVGEEFHLCIADNGVGYSPEAGGEGLGQRLVHMLAAQLGGEVEARDGKPGAIFLITMPVQEAAHADEASWARLRS